MDEIDDLRDFVREGVHLGRPIGGGHIRAALATIDRLEAEVAALRAAGDALARATETLGVGYLLSVVPTDEDDLVDVVQSAIDAWRALAGPGGRREDDR